MKRFLKIVSFVLAFCTLFNIFCVFSFSAEVTSNADAAAPSANESPFLEIVCSYDKVNGIKIDFRMKNENVKKYEGSEISLYKLFGKETFEDIQSGNVEAIRTDIPVGNKTGCELRQVSLEYRLSRYVLAVADKDGNVAYSKEFYPRVKGNDLAQGFKGVDLGNINDNTDALPDTVVIDVQVSKLESANGGYIYPTEYKTYTFGRDFLNELDRQMKIYSGIGARVYLRFTDNDTSLALNGEYDSIMAMYAYTSFLAERYSSESYNGIAGIILADSESACKKTNASVYARYLYSALAAISDGGFDTALIVPVNDTFSLTEAFLEELCESFADATSPMFTVMVETQLNPFGINKEYTDACDALLDPDGFYGVDDDFGDDDRLDYEERLEEGFPKLPSNGTSGEYISPESLTRLLSLLRRLKNSKGCINDNIVYNWTPTDDTVLNTALAALVYNFYKLLFTDRAQCFILTLTDSYDADSRAWLTEIIKYIDSDKADKAFDRNRIAKYFGEDSFDSLIFGFAADKTVRRRIYNYSIYKNQPINIRGYASYFDFSAAASQSGWYLGNGCVSISSVKNNSTRYMSAKMKASKGENAFIVYNYEYSESFAYTDYIAIDFAVTSEGTNETFDLSIVLGGDGFTCEYQMYGLFENSRYTVYLDTASLNTETLTDFIRIGTSYNSDTEEEYQLELYSINALSKIYDNNDLEKLIEAERERLKSYADSSESKEIDYTAIVLIVFVVLLTFLVMFMIARTQRKNKKSKST